MKKLAFLPLIAYLPIFLHPDLLLNRNNDLINFFAPLLLYIKREILTGHGIPFWNVHFFSGTPLLPDPQSLIFYLGTLIFVFLPISMAFLVSLYLHGLIGSLGTYFLCKKLKCQEMTCLFAATMFLIFPRIFGYLEAGHWGLFTAYSWMPLAILFTLNYWKTKKVIWVSLISILLFFILASHIFMFVCVVFIVIVVSLVYSMVLHFKWHIFAIQLALLLLSIFGFCAIFLIPQFAWAPITTRSILLSHPDLYPKWNGIRDIFVSLVWPFNGTIEQLMAKDSEKWISLGVVTSVLAFFAFWKTSKFLRFCIFVSFTSTFLLAFGSIFSSLNITKLMRVTTRPWIIVEVGIFFLCILWIEKSLKSKINKTLLFLIMFAILVEYFFLSWTRILKPISEQTAAPNSLIQTITKDKDVFRVYCTTRCIPQYLAVENGIELVEGYGTLQQENYFKHSWSLVGAYWDYYTLAIPPMGTSIFEKPQPSAKALGEYNTKYVLSPYPLVDDNFAAIAQENDIGLYKNKLFLPRIQIEDSKASFEYRTYTPNSIELLINSHENTNLTIANVWSPGWQANINGKDTPISQTPISQMRVSVPPGISYLRFNYNPPGFLSGAIITALVIISHIILIAIGQRRNRKYNNSK